MSFRLKSLIVSAVTLGSFPMIVQAEAIYGLTNFQNLVTFDSSTRAVSSTVALTGFDIGGEFLRAIDTRPATGQLYGISNMDRLFIVNPTTGTSTLVGGPTSVSFGNSTTSTIDFNPTVDRIRIVNRTAQNGRINPNDGTLVDGDATTTGVQADPNLQYAAGDAGAGTTPSGVGVAYTNSRPGATTTTLYTLDAQRDVLTIQSPANAGTLTTVGSLGFDLGTTAGFVGFDIASSNNAAYLVAFNFSGNPAPTRGDLYTVNLSTGLATDQGAITGLPGFDSIASIAVANIVPEPTSIAAVALLGAPLLRRRRV